MPWITAAATDIGGRDEQQDRYLVVRNDASDSQLLVVADGAGGHVEGALAAQAVIDTVKAGLERLWNSDDPSSVIDTLISECNAAVLAVAKQSGGGEIACSTVVLLFIRKDELFWGHAGDSRFYLIRNQKVVLQTVDHSVGELKQHGDASAFVGVKDNELYMCLGGFKTLEPEVGSGLAYSNDVVLLCSDGLSGQTDIKHLIEQLSLVGNDEPSLKHFVNDAVRLALKNSGDGSDNITVIAAKHVSQPSLIKRAFAPLLTLFGR